MKKTQLFVGIAAFALAIGGFVATKANKKFVAVSSGAFMTGTTSTIGSASSLSGGFTTTTNAFTRVVQLIKTNGTSGSGTVLATLRTSAVSGSKKVYHN